MIKTILIFGIFACDLFDYMRANRESPFNPPRCSHSMPPQRFALPSEVPGLAARRIAAAILDGVLHKHRTLDEQLDGAGAHPGLKGLSDRDRALMRRLVATSLRRLWYLGPLPLRTIARRISNHAASRQIEHLLCCAQSCMMV